MQSHTFIKKYILPRKNSYSTWNADARVPYKMKQLSRASSQNNIGSKTRDRTNQVTVGRDRRQE